MPDSLHRPSGVHGQGVPEALAEGTGHSPEELAQLLDCEHLRDWLTAQRWYASKTRSVSAIEIVEHVTLRHAPTLVLALAQARFATGTHELYQLPLGVARAGDTDTTGQPIGQAGDLVAFDAIHDPVHARELLRRIEGGGEHETEEGCFSFRCVEEEGMAVPDDLPVRVMGVEQSNSSLVFDDRLILKVFRKLEPGINPELEMLRFLTARGFPNIAPLNGWYEYEGTALAGTLGVVQEFIPDACDGWSLALDQLGASASEEFLGRLRTLGAATAQMHNALASDASDPAFSPEEPSNESLSLLTATIDEDIERMFLRLNVDDERLAPILGRGEDVRERLAARAHIGMGGKHIRIHGDYHLGQTLYTPRGWVILDFEGEPARPLPERRQKRSPLRDVASMLRSFAYVTSAVERLRGEPAPEGFEAAARLAFLECYFAEIDPTLLPVGDSAIANMLAIFELEKAIYELRYELDNRPDWVAIPVAGIERLLETS